MPVSTDTSDPILADLIRCPGCTGKLERGASSIRCEKCGHEFELDGDLPQLFWPNSWDEHRDDVTERMREFYEQTPFPNYDDFDSTASLANKARQGRFAKLLDDQIPPGALVLECGCGTGQLTNFLSVANRHVVGSDLCLNSLRLGDEFKRRNGLARAHFVQMNLFQPAFAPGTFDLVVSNGVLHHTSDPRLAFESISRLVKPGGYLLVGLYHRYGRLITDIRRGLFGVFGERLAFLDPNLRASGMAGPKRRAWYMDQYRNPHESKHTIGEVMTWLDEIGFSFVTSLPLTRPFVAIRDDEPLFEPAPAGNAIERTIAELSMVTSGSREGGFFVVIGRRGSE